MVGRKPGKLVGLSPSGVRISPSASYSSYFRILKFPWIFFLYSIVFLWKLSVGFLPGQKIISSNGSSADTLIYW